MTKSRTAVDTLEVFPSNLGWMAVVLHRGAVRRLAFGYSSPDEVIAALGEVDLAQARSSRENRTLVSRLRAFAQGKADDFRDVKLHDPARTEFQNRVIAACRKVRWGKTSSYGELAAAAGSPRAARAVGNIMASNRVPLIIPCHRILASAGRLGGYSHPLGREIKEQLLALEMPRASQPRRRSKKSAGKKRGVLRRRLN